MVLPTLIAQTTRRSAASALRTATASSSSSSSSSLSAASTSCSAGGARFLSVSSLRRAEAAAATTATSAPDAAVAAGSSSKSANAGPKLTGIVDQIEKLTLLEAADLVALLKDRLNIQEIAMPAAGSAGAPAAAAAPSAAADAAADEAEKPKEKTVFTVKLKGLKDASAKAKVIKEIKALNSTMNLVEAKKFVESAPQVLKEGLSKADAEKLQKAIETAGGVVELD